MSDTTGPFSVTSSLHPVCCPPAPPPPGRVTSVRTGSPATNGGEPAAAACCSRPCLPLPTPLALKPGQAKRTRYQESAFPRKAKSKTLQSALYGHYVRPIASRVTNRAHYVASRHHQTPPPPPPGRVTQSPPPLHFLSKNIARLLQQVAGNPPFSLGLLGLHRRVCLSRGDRRICGLLLPLLLLQHLFGVRKRPLQTQTP